MKKRLALLICITMVVGIFSGLSLTAFGKGDGTDDSPYIIKTADEFDKIRDNPGAVYLLDADIELPLSYMPFEFSGKLIGSDNYNLKSITASVNMPTSSSTAPAGGLFTKITGTVRLENIKLKGSVTGQDYLGGFAGSASEATPGAIITNCVNEANIKGNNYIGGILGMSTTANISVINCTNYGMVTGSIGVAGIAGAVNKLTLSRNFGAINGINNVGGLVGVLYGSMSECYNEGDVTGTRGKVGGILSSPSGSRTITKCYNKGTITNKGKETDNDVGGIVGGLLTDKAKANVIECYNMGEVISGAGNFNPLFPATDSIVANGITGESCYYLSEKLEDDGKEGTTAQSSGNSKELTEGVNAIFEKIEALTKFNNPDIKNNIISKLGNSLTLFVGSAVAYVNDGSATDRLRIDSNNIEVTPIVQNGRTLVPARFIAESLGADVSWDEAAQRVTITQSGTTIQLVINSDQMTVGGRQTKIDVPAQLINYRTLVPLRAITEALNKDVFWDDRGLIVIRDSAGELSPAVVDEVVGIWLVASFDELSAKVNNAQPGDDLVVANGVYNYVEIAIDAKGADKLPITVRAQTPGEVVFKENVRIRISGEYIVFRDFRIENVRNDVSVITLEGASNSRITECYFYDIFGEASTFVGTITAGGISQNNRVDHNVFETTGGGLYVLVGYNENAMNTNNKMDHNYFRDVPAVSDIFPGQTNGFEQALMGTAIIHDHNRPMMVIEDNLFENIVGDKSELICVKSSGNIVRYNTFLNSDQTGPDFRNGYDCVFEGNFSINLRIGMRSYGADQVFKNNYFYNCDRGLELTSTDEGYVYQEGSQYRQTKNAVITGNMFIRPNVTGIKYGSGFNPTSGYIYVPENTTLADNVFVVDRGNVMTHSNSMFDKFSNNKFSLSGGAVLGTDADGFTKEEVKLVFDGQIYVPEGMEIDKRGLKTVNDVGPENRWWLPLLKSEPDDIAESVKEPEGQPKSYTPSQSEISLIEGEEYSLDLLVGKASYDKYSYSVLSGDVEYTLDGGGVAEIDGRILKATGVGTTGIKAVYKGTESVIRLNVFKSSVKDSEGEIYKKSFDGQEDFIGLRGDSSFKVSGGKLTNAGVSTNVQRMIIDNSAVVDGDFKLSLDMTVKDYEATGGLNGSIILGYKQGSQPDYYSVRLGNTKASLNHIFKFNDTISNNIGIINTLLTEDKTHRVEITKIKDKLIVNVDGELAGIADVDENLSGRIGFASTKVAEFDNVSISRLSESPTSDSAKISITPKRTDVEEVELGFGGGLSDVIYRVYRNGIWLYDTSESKYIDDSIRQNIEYKYEIKAYNASGALQGTGELTYSLPEAVDGNLFRITNCLVRTGWNGEFAADMYKVRNKGLYNDQRMFCDRVYRFTELPAELENAAYIMTRNVDIAFANLQKAETSDFMKFDINKSATVYLLLQPNQSTVVPEWIAANGWELTTMEKINYFSRIYKKHVEVPPGKTATVTIGGFAGKLSMMYIPVIVPD